MSRGVVARAERYGCLRLGYFVFARLSKYSRGAAELGEYVKMFWSRTLQQSSLTAFGMRLLLFVVLELVCVTLKRKLVWYS